MQCKVSFKDRCARDRLIMAFDYKKIGKLIKDLLSKISEDFDIVYYLDNNEDSFIAEIIKGENKSIRINKHWLPSLKSSTLKTVILHEIGHHKTGWNMPKWKMEYQAQMWALNKAREFKMVSVEKRILQTFIEWGEEKDELSFKSYYKAYLEAKKQGVI